MAHRASNFVAIPSAALATQSWLIQSFMDFTSIGICNILHFSFISLFFCVYIVILLRTHHLSLYIFANVFTLEKGQESALKKSINSESLNIYHISEWSFAVCLFETSSVIAIFTYHFSLLTCTSLNRFCPLKLAFIWASWKHTWTHRHLKHLNDNPPTRISKLDWYKLVGESLSHGSITRLNLTYSLVWRCHL